jgi:hypothetical protein
MHGQASDCHTARVANSERSAIVRAAVLLIPTAGVPWWALGTDSPVTSWWIVLTLGIWLTGAAAGLALVVSGRRFRAVGWSILLGVGSGVALFVAFYLGAFAQGDWGSE